MQPAMANGRCRYHGGKNPIKHGRRTNRAIQQRHERAEEIKQLRKALSDLKGMIKHEKETTADGDSGNTSID
jgi:hypothetical protein